MPPSESGNNLGEGTELGERLARDYSADSLIEGIAQGMKGEPKRQFSGPVCLAANHYSSI
jgi:hypothetical protein